jgi:hypothetical protein
MTGMGNSSLLSFAIDPVTPTTLYAGVAGNPAVFKTTNGADNWRRLGMLLLLSSFRFLSRSILIVRQLSL